MRLSNSCLAATLILGASVVIACSSSATPMPTIAATPSPSVARVTAVTSSPTASPILVVTPIPKATALHSAIPTRSAAATPRVVELTAVLKVAREDRFETFGGEAIRLEHVWSPNDTGLGGTCSPTVNVPWLECLNLDDWLIQPVAEGAGCPFTLTSACYDGPRLKILYEPGMHERLGLGDGPVVLIGHFGDPASEGCLPKNRDACRDRFVVTAIEQARH